MSWHFCYVLWNWAVTIQLQKIFHHGIYEDSWLHPYPPRGFDSGRRSVFQPSDFGKSLIPFFYFTLYFLRSLQVSVWDAIGGGRVGGQRLLGWPRPRRRNAWPQMARSAKPTAPKRDPDSALSAARLVAGLDCATCAWAARWSRIMGRKKSMKIKCVYCE